MDHTGETALARAGLAPQEDGGVLGSDPADLLDHFPHPPARREEERFIPRDDGDLRLRDWRNGLRPSGTTATGKGQNINEIAETPQIQRAAQIVGNPQAEQRQGLLCVILITQDQNWNTPAPGLERAEQTRETRYRPRRSEVGQDQRGSLARNPVTGFVVILDPFDPNTRSPSNDFLNHTGQGRILTDQHHCHIVQGSPPLAGDRSLTSWYGADRFQTGDIPTGYAGSTFLSFASPDSTNTTRPKRATLYSKRPLRSLTCGVHGRGRVSAELLSVLPDLSGAF